MASHKQRMLSVVSYYARLVVGNSFQAVEITPEKEVLKPDSIFRCLPLF